MCYCYQRPCSPSTLSQLQVSDTREMKRLMEERENQATAEVVQEVSLNGVLIIAR